MQFFANGLVELALSMALVSTHTIPRLLDLLAVGQLETAALMVTHGIAPTDSPSWSSMFVPSHIS